MSLRDHLRLIFADNLGLIRGPLRSALKRHAPFLVGRLLDAGCGHRRFQHLVSCSEYIGLEIAPKGPQDVKGSILDIPFPDASFDSAICLEVLEHVPEPPRAVAELHRVLRPGSHLHLTTPQMWYAHHEPHDYFRYTRHGLRHLLEGAGFEVLTLERTGGFWRFLAARLTETWYRFLRIALFPLAVHNRSRNRVALFFCFPFNLLGTAILPLLDRLSRRDHLGWVVLARRPLNDVSGRPAGRGDGLEFES